MSKVCLFAGVAVFGLMAADAPSFAQCAKADRCSQQECDARQRAVHPACDTERSCNKSGLTRTDLENRLLQNQQCLQARQHVQQCYSTTDAGHESAIEAVKNAIKTCQSLIK